MPSPPRHAFCQSPHRTPTPVGVLPPQPPSAASGHDKTTSVVRQADERRGERNCCRLISPPSADASIRPPRKARDERLARGQGERKGGRGAAANSFFSLALCTWKTGSLGVTAFSRDWQDPVVCFTFAGFPTQNNAVIMLSLSHARCLHCAQTCIRPLHLSSLHVCVRW